MQLAITYTGDLGEGQISLTLSSQDSLQVLFEAFHKVIDKPDFYTIQGGAPPHRRKMKVHYSYEINGQRVRDKSILLGDAGLSDGDSVNIYVGGGGMVD